MPHIAVMMYPGRDDETKRKLAEKIRNVVMEELHVVEDVVAVSMFDIAKEDFPKAVENIPDSNIIIRKKQQ